MLSMGEQNNGYISAKEISNKFRIPYPTINHYTNLGFFSVVKRRGNKRLFSEKDVRAKLIKIAQLKDEGYPLSLIIKMLGR